MEGQRRFAMWFDKKTRPEAEPSGGRPAEVPTTPEEAKISMSEPVSKATASSAATSSHTVLGRTAVVQGQLSSSEDLLIEGKFEGNVNLNDHCLTVGAEGQVKAEIRARQVVVLGSVTGNVVAREKIEIRRTGHVVGDLVAGSVAIEEGAYFKGSIDITRGDTEASRGATVPSTLRSSA